MAMSIIDNFVEEMDHNFKDINGKTIHIGDIIIISTFDYYSCYGNKYYLYKGIVVKMYKDKFEYVYPDDIDKLNNLKTSKHYCKRSNECVMIVNDMYQDLHKKYIGKVKEFNEKRDAEKNEIKSTKYVPVFLIKDEMNVGMIYMKRKFQTSYMKKADRLAIEEELKEKYPDYKLYFLNKKKEMYDEIKTMDIYFQAESSWDHKLISNQNQEHFIKIEFINPNDLKNSKIIDVITQKKIEIKYYNQSDFWRRVPDQLEEIFSK